MPIYKTEKKDYTIYRTGEENTIMTKAIWFDMDGTIANLYGVENWLGYIIAEETKPYAIAEPLVNMNALARVLNRLNRNGYTINIVSWTAKNGTAEYNEAVAEVKKAWLKKHLASVKFTAIDILPYGTNKAASMTKNRTAKHGMERHTMPTTSLKR